MLDSDTWSQEQQQLLSALLGAAAGAGGPGATNPVAADMQEQQRRLLAAMMGNAGAIPPPQQQQRRASSVPPQGPSPEDPLSALLAMSAQQEGGDMPPMPDFLKNMAPPPTAVARPKTLLEKLLPIVHLAAAWILLAYFIFWKEPEAYESRTYGAVKSDNRWTRWADLARRRPEEGWGVQFVVSTTSAYRWIDTQSRHIAVLLGVHDPHNRAPHMEDIPRAGTFHAL